MTQTFKKREKALLYITVFIVIFSIAFKLFISPALDKNDALNKEISFTRLRIKKYLKLLSQKDYLRSKYEKFSLRLKDIEAEGETFVSVLSELEGLARDSGTRITDMRPLTKSSASGKEMLVDLKTEGTVEDCMKFIYEIENSPRLLTIEKFQLRAKPGTHVLEGIFSISQPYLE